MNLNNKSKIEFAQDILNSNSAIKLKGNERRESIRKCVINYVKDDVKNGHYPGFLEIKKKFKIGPHTYFNTVKEIYGFAGIKYDRLHSYKIKLKCKKEANKKQILNYIKNKAYKRKQCTRDEIEDKFHVGLYYCGGIRDLYNEAGIEFKPHFGPRLKEEKNKIKKEIIRYVKSNKNRRVSAIELKKKFKIGIETYFPLGMKQLYEEAGINTHNQFLYMEKEKKFTYIAKRFLEDNGHKIITVSIEKNRRGPDIIVKDGENNIVPVELKSYHKDNPLCCTLHAKNDNSFDQVTNYIKNINASYGILMTSADNIHQNFISKVPSNIKIFLGQDIISHFAKNSNILKELNWVRTTISDEKEKYIVENRKKIASFIKTQSLLGKHVNTKITQKELKLDLLVYFKDIFEAYKASGSKYPAHKRRMSGRGLSPMEKELMKKKICKFIKEKWLKGERINSNRIRKIFKVHFKTYFKNVSDMYKEAQITLPDSEIRRRYGVDNKLKSEMRKRILEFIKESINQNKTPTKEEVIKKFQINIETYFNSFNEALKLANGS